MTTPSYVTPDFALIRESRESIRYQSIVGSANLYIKALSDELVGLNAAVSSTDQLVANAITSAITALETEDLHENLEALAVLTGREANEDVKNAIKQYSKTANLLMELCTSQIAKLYTQLQNGVFNVQSITISNNRFRLAELADKQVSLNKELTTEQVPLDALRGDEDILNEAIKVFEKLTFIDRLKPLLEQLTKLMGDKPETPEAAAMKAGLIVANTFLDEANELTKYRDLLKARQIIQARIDQRQERVTSLKAQLRDINDKTRQLNDTQKVVPHQQVYVHEANKLVESLSAFLTSGKPAANEGMLANGNRLIGQCHALRTYLNVLQGRWMRG
ncbi:alpha-xenorhabdolysin family binary toxin subunit B [Pseudomonas frederiksbergensis]|uniref:alpha-xenorhabdolysin family binary toxin subunit B n=1 Tax=Pseudomonas frederiksbergensis TaxID=104087 RepID=UPI003D011F0D